MVVGLIPAFAQNASETEAPDPAPAAALPALEEQLPPGRVGRVGFVSGTVDLRTSRETGWADAVLNQPIFTGEAVRTDRRARAEIQIGANTIDLPAGTEIEITSLSDQLTQIALLRGRIDLHLHLVGDEETVEIDFPLGAFGCSAPVVTTSTQVTAIDHHASRSSRALRSLSGAAAISASRPAKWRLWRFPTA